MRVLPVPVSPWSRYMPGPLIKLSDRNCSSVKGGALLVTASQDYRVE